MLRGESKRKDLKFVFRSTALHLPFNKLLLVAFFTSYYQVLAQINIFSCIICWKIH